MITPFKFYCQKVLPLVYDDSLSYYETLCKISEKLNEVIENENALSSEFENLQTWINTQLESYAKGQLQEWLDNGTLEKIINEQIFGELNDRLNTVTNNVNILMSKSAVHMSDYVIPNGNDDNTTLMQQAINAAQGKVLIIDGAEQPYRCNQLTLNSNSIYVCEPTTVIKANDTWINSDLWQAPLIDFRKITNVKWLGNGATITMNKPQTPTVEHAHCMGTRGASNIYIENMILSNASGDGFYIDQYDEDTTNTPSSNVTINNIYCNNNARQGMSIVSGYNLSIKNSVFANTVGLAPQSGLNIEPELRSPNMRNIKISNCDFINNQYSGLVMSGSAINPTTPFEVFVTDCSFTGANIGININNFPDGVVGSVKINNCIIKNTRYNSIFDSANVNTSIIRTYSNCTCINANSSNNEQTANTIGEGGWASACQIYSKNAKTNGNAYFYNCHVIDNNDTPKCKTAFAVTISDTARVTGAGFIGCTAVNIPTPILGYGLQARDISFTDSLAKPNNNESSRTVDTTNYYQLFRNGTLKLGPCFNQFATIEFVNTNGPTTTLTKGEGVSIYPGNPTTITLPSIGSRIFLKTWNGYDYFITGGINYTNT